jgi:catechol 2,3-dioxygenase-like lactoylglutathione lyase family enzyme
VVLAFLVSAGAVIRATIPLGTGTGVHARPPDRPTEQTREDAMEEVISKLLSDFERGKMSRRQLISTLAVTAAASSAPAIAAEPAKGFKTVAVNHLSYNVKDYKKTAAFYQDLMGMTVSHDNGKTQCFLEFGNTFVVVRNAREGRAPGSIDHVAYTIDTWDKAAVEAELKRRGFEPRPDTDNSFHILDPDGYDIQISGRAMDPKLI